MQSAFYLRRRTVLSLGCKNPPCLAVRGGGSSSTVSVSTERQLYVSGVKTAFVLTQYGGSECCWWWVAYRQLGYGAVTGWYSIAVSVRTDSPLWRSPRLLSHAPPFDPLLDDHHAGDGEEDPGRGRHGDISHSLTRKEDSIIGVSLATRTHTLPPSPRRIVHLCFDRWGSNIVAVK